MLKVASWNVMQPLSKPWRVYGQEERADRIGPAVSAHLPDVDILVLQELITSDAHRKISADLHSLGFTHVAGGLAGSTFRVPGGVFVFSKHPIDAHDSCIFSSCSGFDCFASKGVVYAHIKGVHVFATHMQSDAGGISARRAQAKTIAECITSLELGKDAPVLLVGDLNIDLLDVAELREFEQTVGMRRVDDDLMPTMDPHTNPLVGHDNPSQWPPGCWSDYRTTHVCACCPTTRLDHMMISGDIMAIGRARAINAEVDPFDIETDAGTVTLTSPSDHYPIVCSFKTVPAAMPTMPLVSARFKSPDILLHDVWIWFAIAVVLLIIIIIIVFAMSTSINRST